MDTSARPTVADVHGESHFAQLAQKHWPATKKAVTQAQPDFLKTEIWDALEKDHFPTSSILLLENLQLLDRYLWPSFDDDASDFHVLLIVLLVNAKRRESLPTWSVFADRPPDFSVLFRRFLSLVLDESLTLEIRAHVLVAIIGAFQSLDNGFIRKECAPLVSVSTWHSLHSAAARDSLLERHGQFKKAWKAANKRYEAADETAKARSRYERSWLYTLVLRFLDILYNHQQNGSAARSYCERFMEFLTDLQSQFPTRRYVNTLLQDLNILVAIELSPLCRSSEGGLFRDFFALLRHYSHFPIDDHTGRQFSSVELSKRYDAQIAKLQRVALKHFKEKLGLLALANHGSLGRREDLESHLQSLNDDELVEYARLLGYRTEYPGLVKLKFTRAFTTECILFDYERKPTFQEVIKEMPILPTEQTLYEQSFIRNETYDGSHPLALPKLNLQYLTVGDFLWRSFILCRCEAFYEIRTALEDTVKRLQLRRDPAAGHERSAGTKMALAISRPAIIEAFPPKVGEKYPAEVRAEVILNMSRISPNVQREWESLRPDDVVYLIALDKPGNSQRTLTNGNSDSSIPEKPFRHLRIAEVAQVLDDQGRSVRATQHQLNGHGVRRRQIRVIVKLDNRAYHGDVLDTKKGRPDIYDSINFIVRRRSRENNFKPVLDSIRKLALSDVPISAWLQDVFLGMGDPAGASYKSLPNALKTIDFRDTFLDWTHLRESLPYKALEVAKGVDNEELRPPYMLSECIQKERDASQPGPKRRRGAKEAAPTQGNDQKAQENKNQETDAEQSKSSKKRRRDEMEDENPSERVEVSSYEPINMGPYPADAPKPNKIRFTPAQVEAITSGTQPGLTVIVGPPGTGKTDVATQIINSIYHNFSNERILLVAHSNQALNQLFQKIVALDIDERHLLRLGHGEEELQLEKDASFSKHGRVEHFLEKGAGLLTEVSRLAASIGAPGAHGQSCETAEYFNAVYIKPLWQSYLSNCKQGSAEEVVQKYPFHDFFANAPKRMFDQQMGKDEAFEVACGGYRHIEKLFVELAEIRPFEVLRNDRLKANYLLVKEARVIAMTSTYAGMRQQEIANLGFHYDNVVMEEAAQIKEIENFIPLALQKPHSGELPLKRVVMCGDHLQNSPIVQSTAFRQYANLEQSLFLRLVRLGVPTIMLDKQGRARPSIAELFSWRYPHLGNLPNVETEPEYRRANAGFRYEYQFINVPDYKGKGEMTPTPHFVQNLGEAEYAVALFMYMRLLGYPASKISILTPYAGQRSLIRDVLGHRCAGNRLFGLPRIVTTVDKYQGEQNDCACSLALLPPTDHIINSTSG